MKSSVTQIVAGIKRCMVQRLVPMIHGSPGIGKSDIVKQLAKAGNLHLIDWRGSSADPVDLSGFPVLDGSKASYLPFDTFPIAGDKKPKGTNGWLLFMDELNSAPISVQKACYKLILDRMVGNHDLHPEVYIVAAGNLTTDGALISNLPTALQSRMVHFEMGVCNDSWNQWATEAGIDCRIISFIGFKPNLLHKFSPKHNDYTFACPRTWEMASKLIKGRELDLTDKALLSGVLSQGVAIEFIAYTKVFESLPHIDKIIADPSGTSIPAEPSARFAVGSHVAEHMTVDNATVLMEYVRRLPLENQTITFRIAIGKNKKLLLNDAIEAWSTQYATRKVA